MHLNFRLFGGGVVNVLNPKYSFSDSFTGCELPLQKW